MKEISLAHEDYETPVGSAFKLGFHASFFAEGLTLSMTVMPNYGTVTSRRRLLRLRGGLQIFVKTLTGKTIMLPSTSSRSEMAIFAVRAFFAVRALQ